ncbi:MAG: hypothetical protein HYX76_07060 [Acidobacteria bacterium]|nr:hypothetical protein [Acidobacteriota bacterium]
MLKRSLVAAVAAVLALAVTSVNADVSATLLLRSGERINGQLIDMGADFTMRVNGVEQHYPIGDVAVIDFVGGGLGLPDTETSAVTPGRHLLLLRGAQSFYGTLVDFTGAPLKAVFRIESGEERPFEVSQVGRIYLTRPPGAPVATTGAVTAPQGGLIVPATSQWTSTGMFVTTGELISFNATGEIRLSGDPNDVANPDGSKTQRFAGGSALPSNFAGAFIARVGNSAPFPIGSNAAPVRMPSAGMLWVGINDDNVSDNAGEFRVVINRAGMERRRK